MTLTADELICHNICANYDIETIQYHKLHRFYGKSAPQLLRSFAATRIGPSHGHGVESVVIHPHSDELKKVNPHSPFICCVSTDHYACASHSIRFRTIPSPVTVQISMQDNFRCFPIIASLLYLISNLGTLGVPLYLCTRLVVGQVHYPRGPRGDQLGHNPRTSV